MKLQIEESTPAEFDELTPAQFGVKLRKALFAMLPPSLVDALSRELIDPAPHDPSECGSGGACQNNLRKASDGEARPRGGELQLVEDLAVMLTARYTATTDRMIKSIESQALAGAREKPLKVKGKGRDKGQGAQK